MVYQTNNIIKFGIQAELPKENLRSNSKNDEQLKQSQSITSMIGVQMIDYNSNFQSISSVNPNLNMLVKDEIRSRIEVYSPKIIEKPTLQSTLNHLDIMNKNAL